MTRNSHTTRGLAAIVGVALCAVVIGLWVRPVPSHVDATSLTLFQERLERGALAGWNFLFITVDTVRADHIGCYGYAAAQTPTIDGLARRGVQFDHAVTGVPSTLPSHCTMMTGLEVPNHGVRTNAKFILDDKITTLAEVLKDNGYATAAIVATFILDARFGLAQGFDHYDSIQLPDPGTGRIRPRQASTVTEEATTWLSEYLETQPQRPFFLWVHYFDPHDPYVPPPEFARLFPDSPYDGEIAYVDSQLPPIFDLLDAHGLTERTLVILTSDHGEGLGDHLEKAHSRYVYDTTMWIPLIVSCPQFYDAPCHVDDVTVGTIDIMPTVLSLLGIDTSLDMDGIDLVTDTVTRDRAMYLETLGGFFYNGWAALHSLRRIDAKYIAAPFPEYYNLVDDPNELNNLLDSDPHVADELAALLAQRMQPWQPAESVVPTAAPLSRDRRKHLAGLGYVSTVSADGDEPPERPDPKDMVPILGDLKRNDPVQMQRRSRELAGTPGADKFTYRRAVILAKAACPQVPDDGECLNALGVAQYRAGSYDEAIASLTESEQVLAASGQGQHPGNIAFIAMARYQLGQTAAAQTMLRSLRAVTTDAKHADNEAIQGYLAEAEALIGTR